MVVSLLFEKPITAWSGRSNGKNRATTKGRLLRIIFKDLTILMPLKTFPSVCFTMFWSTLTDVARIPQNEHSCHNSNVLCIMRTVPVTYDVMKRLPSVPTLTLIKLNDSMCVKFENASSSIRSIVEVSMMTDVTLLKFVKVSERKVGTVIELNKTFLMFLNLLNAPLEILNNVALNMNIDLKSSSSSNASGSMFSIVTLKTLTLYCVCPVRFDKMPDVEWFQLSFA